MTNQFPEQDNRSPVYFDEDINKWVLRISDAGICTTAIVALKLGKRRDPPSKTLLAAYQDGIAAEAEIEAHAKVAYNLNPSGQVRVELELNDDWILRGHCDGYDPPYLLEYKNLGVDLYGKFRRGGLEKMGDVGVKYAIQTYLYAIGLESKFGTPIVEVLFHCKERVKEGQIDYGRFFGRPYTPAELARIGNISLDSLATKVSQADQYVETREMPPCTTKSYGCPVWTLHDSMDVFSTRGNSDKKIVGKDTPTFAIMEIDNLIDEYHEVVEARKKADKREKEIKAHFEEIMNDKQLTRYTSPDRQFTLGLVSSHSSKLDEEAMAEDGIDVEKYRRTKPYTYVREY